jgi:chromosome segregation ATPase
VATLLPRVAAWRAAAAAQAERRREIQERIAEIEAGAAAAQAAAAEAAAALAEVTARCAEAKDPGGKLLAATKGGKAPKYKPLPQELAEELADCDAKSEELADAAHEATAAFDQALADLGSGSGVAAAASWANDAALGAAELATLVARALRVVKFLWDEVGEHPHPL